MSLQIHGRVIIPGIPVLYNCGNVLCVNPSHIITGDEARFWRKVNKTNPDQCWTWLASKDKDDYGKFRANNKDIRAHQYSYQLHSGTNIPDGMCVCHTCDNPPCVNPNHLFLGTIQDNNQDKINKNRQARGERSGASKLKSKQVLQIRMFRPFASVKELASLFKITSSSTHSILLRKSWKHI